MALGLPQPPSEDNNEEQRLVPAAHMYTATNETMASSKTNDSSNSGVQDTTSDTNDEEKSELCPGFKDVDAFVKVSER